MSSTVSQQQQAVPIPLEQQKQRGGPIACQNCGKPCKGEALRVQNKHFHIKCFACKVCGSELAQGGFFVRQGEYICTLDYQRMYGTRCFSCQDFIEGEVVSALGKTYHPRCFVCASCKQPFPAGDRVTFNGKECICQTCTEPLASSSPAPIQAVHNCCGCGKEFKNEQSLVALDKHWHLGCFKCKVCNKVLNAEYISKDGIPYCEMDYHAMFGIQCESCKKYITGKVLEAGEKHYHPTCARCARCELMFAEGEEMYLQGSSIWHPPCRQAAKLEEKSKNPSPSQKQVRIQLNDVPEQQVTRTSSESITSVPASSASGSPSRVIYAKLGEELLDYKDLAALPKTKAIYNIDRPDMLSYSPYISYPSEERHYGESPQLLSPTPTEGDGEKSPRQRRPSSPSSNSSLGGYGRYTPCRSPQNYSRGPEGNPGSKHREQDSLPLPPASVGGVKYPSTWARDSSSSLPMYHSGGAEGSRGGGGECSGKYSPVPPGGSGGLSLHLNPTTLAMLQQHNFIPYFRGFKQDPSPDPKPRTALHLSLPPANGSESGRSTPSLSTYSDGKSPSSATSYVAAPRHFHIPETMVKDNIYRKPPIYKQHAMEELVCELRLFLDLLDREYLSAGVREKKIHLSNILHRVLADKEPSFKSEIHSGLPAPPQMPLPEIPHPWLAPTSGPPPLPSSSLPEGYYEEAVPLSPGKAPEYITSNYDSDAMSSSYESYDEEEEDGKGQKMRHQWPSEEASMDLVKDARICAFLLRKKRFGQWTKLLCVIKDNKLLCYKSSKDHTPQMELTLSGCSITHIPRDGKKKKHELKIVHQGADALVLAVQSKEQADEWLKVMREVCASGIVDSDGAGSGSPVHKPELEKKASCDRPSSDGEAAHENGHVDCKDQGKGKKNSKAEQKVGTVGKGAGKKITKIIGLGKKKPSTDEQTSSAEEDVPTCGYLNVLSNNRWRERWCRLKDNQLLLHKDRDDLKSHIASLPLRGCEVSPGLDHKHPFAFRLLRNGQEVAVLEASSSEGMGRWLGVLLAETGSTTDPATLHYDYIDVETTANVIQLAKQSFCFTSKRAVSPNPYLDNPLNGYACPTGMALHYDDVPINGTLKGKKGPITNGTASKQKADQKNQNKKNGVTGTNGTTSLKRNNSNAEQCKYGKNRVEADAKRLQSKEDELTKRKQEIRNHLTQLKKERRDLRTAIEAAAGKRSQASLSERLKKVEEDCRQKEEERVTLELEMTEVKESLKKALSGGVTLGLTIEPKAGSSGLQSPAVLRRTQESSPFSSCDTSDTESCSLPVNSASLLRRHQVGQKASPVRGHVLRKAKEWEQKSGT